MELVHDIVILNQSKIMRLEGKNAYIEIKEDKVEIGPKGWRGHAGQRGIVRVNLKDIKAIELTPPGLLTFGFLKVVSAEGAVIQGQSAYGRKGDLMSDPYAVAYKKADAQKYEKARDLIEELISNLSTENQSTNVLANDIPAQLEKLAALRDSGILTEEEFTTKKAELLAKM